MYAISETGIRTVTEDMPLSPGETRVVEVPAALLHRIRGVQVRAERSQRLRATDWTQAPDSPLLSDVMAAWAVYRQELRDLPAQAGFPDCAWPEPPALSEGAAGQERAPLQT